MATISKEITISSEGVYVVELNAIPDGSTVTPVNDIQTWLHCGSIYDKNYTTISQVLNDQTIFNILVQNANACNYMARSTNWASSVAGNAAAMTIIGSNTACGKKLLANSTWRSAICSSSYFESVLTKKVPTMSSNTSPSGECYGSALYQGAAADYWMAFNGNNTTACDVAGAGWMAYDFGSSGTIPYAFKYVLGASANVPYALAHTIYIEGSNSKTSGFVTLATKNFTLSEAQGILCGSGYFANFANNAATKYRYMRIRMGNYNYSYGTMSACMHLQFYGLAS